MEHDFFTIDLGGGAEFFWSLKMARLVENGLDFFAFLT